MRIKTSDAAGHLGKQITLNGWVAARRDHGKLIFIDLRDRWGIVQLVITPASAAYQQAQEVRQEWVLQVAGKVRERPEGMKNPHIASGEVEVEVESLEVLAASATPPFPLETDGRDIEETIRLRYRYLDLRRERLQKNILLRHRVVQFAREYLSKRDFIEIETPLLTKSTPEGSRDFLVPSRLQPGHFYALPQSPQQYKQLLMVAGFERYFQIARCLRDEDLRADRAFEHTQIDLEMSFVTREEVMRLVENMLIALFEHFGKHITQKPFPVFTYKEACEKFGGDKFDLRKDKNDPDEAAFAWVVDFPVFEKDDESGRLTYSHNPFTAPRPEDEKKLLEGKDLESLISLQYDIVCNGYEIGGGGIRIHKPEVLEKVFSILGHSPTAIQKKFGHMLEAFSFGAPPHGGIALGLERIIMILAHEEAIREVTAFPMTSGGTTAVMEAPTAVAKEQLAELGIKVVKKNS
ncbi:aspartate--tRNA ligase [Candidatus Parcubacteria bacterium]|nr:MAG: aspartate--tRNA ligase [Candidatus Parcubacteria bacterium]